MWEIKHVKKPSAATTTTNISIIVLFLSLFFFFKFFFEGKHIDRLIWIHKGNLLMKGFKEPSQNF